MHPLLRTPKRLGLYILAWSLPAALVACVLAFSGTLNWPQSIAVAVGLALLYAAICLTPWYVCRMLPLRDSQILKALLNHIAAAFVSAVIWTTAARVFAPAPMKLHLAPLFATGVLLYLLSVALHYVYLTIEDSKEAVRHEQQARILAREAELKALKAQINPHFLFNSLNSISALTALDPGLAREMCIRLSDFLRNTLRLGERESIPFSEELVLINAYLAVEQVRFGARLSIERNIDAACETCSVPPLLLQPLIENSVKHGIAGLIAGGAIHLTASCSGGMLRVIVENDFDPESPAPRHSGLGLANVRSRIEARHGSRGRLDVMVGDSRHRVDVLIPCEGLNA
jgi:two-component system, LytTR family, sensor histidine kinase AlgZ